MIFKMLCRRIARKLHSCPNFNSPSAEGTPKVLNPTCNTSCVKLTKALLSERVRSRPPPSNRSNRNHYRERICRGIFETMKSFPDQTLQALGDAKILRVRDIDTREYGSSFLLRKKLRVWGKKLLFDGGCRGRTRSDRRACGIQSRGFCSTGR